MPKRTCSVLGLLALLTPVAEAQQDAPGPVPLAELATRGDRDWERLADGSLGVITEFRGAGGVAIPAYLRKPAGSGPFPVIVMLHGGPHGKEVTVATGRSSPPAGEFAGAGWAVLAIDYRPDPSPPPQAVLEDSMAAVAAVRQLPFLDADRVGLLGG